MKKTIKQLEEQLKTMEADRDKFYSKYLELKEKEDKRKEQERFMSGEQKSALANEIKDLLEIIRWQIRPNTAEAPFSPTKDQRDERLNRY